METKMRAATYWGGFLLLLALAFSSCKKDPPEEPGLDYGTGIFVVNEGNFTWGNASLSFIDANGTVNEKVFEGETGRPLGDVAQSMVEFEGAYFLVVNNSGKIEKVDRNLQESCAITGLTSPRHMAFISSNKAYVTDLYANAISIVDPSDCSVSGQIPIGSWTEDILLVNGEVFVCEMGADRLLVVDPSVDRVVDSIVVGREPNSLALDANGKLWVLCSGGIDEALPRLLRIDPGTRSVELDLSFPSLAESPARLVPDPTGTQLYFLNGDVFTLSISASQLPETPFIPANDHLFYGLSIHPESGDIYVTDAIDYVQRGQLLQYSASDGRALGNWATGIIPSQAFFIGQ